jgi:hypothetical protein
MTTVTIDARSVRFRVPVLRLGRLRAAIVVHVTERVELRVEERRRRAATPTRTARAVATALERADAHRTDALRHRLPV